MVIRSKNIEIFSYMIEKGAQIEKSAKEINCLFLNLMDAWDEAYIPIIEKMDLPLKECGGPALCCSDFHNLSVLAEYLLLAGVSINYKEGFEGPPILDAVRQNHFEIVRFLVEHGADLSLKDSEGVRPYIAAKKIIIPKWQPILRRTNLRNYTMKKRRINYLKTIMCQRLWLHISKTGI